MKIWVNGLVSNEDRYLWFSIMSVINYVDKILIWDTGSNDNTFKIVKEIKKNFPSKIDFQTLGSVTADEFPKIRQKMLEKTFSDWLIILDGDEVWWNESIKETVKLIYLKGNNMETIVHRYFNLVGDIFHYQPEEAGMYEIDGEKGHLNIRAMNRNIPGLYAAKPHGQQGYFDNENNLVQKRKRKKRIFIKKPSYLHFTHLKRSTSLDDEVPKRAMKYKVELGKAFPLDFYYPEVFLLPRPNFIPSPWKNMKKKYYFKGLLTTPIRKIKRKIFRRPSGY